MSRKALAKKGQEKSSKYTKWITPKLVSALSEVGFNNMDINRLKVNIDSAEAASRGKLDPPKKLKSSWAKIWKLMAYVDFKEKAIDTLTKMKAKLKSGSAEHKTVARIIRSYKGDLRWANKRVRTVPEASQAIVRRYLGKTETPFGVPAKKNAPVPRMVQTPVDVKPKIKPAKKKAPSKALLAKAEKPKKEAKKVNKEVVVWLNRNVTLYANPELKKKAERIRKDYNALGNRMIDLCPEETPWKSFRALGTADQSEVAMLVEDKVHLGNYLKKEYGKVESALRNARVKFVKQFGDNNQYSREYDSILLRFSDAVSGCRLSKHEIRLAGLVSGKGLKHAVRAAEYKRKELAAERRRNADLEKQVNKNEQNLEIIKMFESANDALSNFEEAEQRLRDQGEDTEDIKQILEGARTSYNQMNLKRTGKGLRKLRDEFKATIAARQTEKGTPMARAKGKKRKRRGHA